MKLEIMGERRPSRVSGVYRSEEDARGAAYSLINDGKFDSDSICITFPKDKRFAEKIEPDQEGIARTLVRTHVVFGLSGLLLGLLFSVFLALFGPPLTQSSPWFTVVAVALIFLFLGLILAGLVGIRPDHDLVIENTRHATQSGCWAVVVHTLNKNEKYRAKAVMNGSADSLYETR